MPLHPRAAPAPAPAPGPRFIPPPSPAQPVQPTDDDAPSRASASVAASSAFYGWPLLGPLLFDNETSDARDHCANERSNGSHGSPERAVWCPGLTTTRPQLSCPRSVSPSTWPSSPSP